MANSTTSSKPRTAQTTVSGAGTGTSTEAGSQNELVLVAIEGGVWACAPVSERPQVVLTDWRVFDVPLPGKAKCTRHFVGYNISDYEGRVSSPIVKFDHLTMCGVTKSGRVYALRGSSGWNGDAEYTWNRWLAMNRVTDVVDITADFATLQTRPP